MRFKIVNEEKLLNNLSDMKRLLKYNPLYSNYHIEKIDVEKVVEDNDLLNNKSILDRRTKDWGKSFSDYHYNDIYNSTPIRLSFDGNSYKVLDGNHRLIALYNDGYDEIYALVKNVDKIEEAYLDDEEKFYDYKTGNVDGKDIFDLHKTGFSYYNNFLNKQDAEYMKNTRNLVGGILYLTPTEYFEECASIFNSSVDNQINQIKADTEIINQLKEVITKYKRKFPLTYLNIATKQQEGRHRMYVAGELFGWDTKFPVLVVQDTDDIRVKTEPLFEAVYSESLIEQDLSKQLIAYHSTPNKFNRFSKEYIGCGAGACLGDGFYFSNVPITTYGDSIKVKLNIKKPYEFDLSNKEQVIKFLQDIGISDLEEIENWFKYYSNDYKASISKLIKEHELYDLQPLKDRGYDSLKVHNTNIGIKDKRKLDTEYLVFDEDKIEILGREPLLREETEQDISRKYDDIVDFEIKYINEYLDKYGFEVELEDTAMWEDELKDVAGLFLNSIQDNASVFPIALNKNIIIENSETIDELIGNIRATIAHEAGHGIFEYLNDIIDLDDLDEEETVEDFAYAYEDRSIADCELIKILDNYVNEAEKDLL